MGEPTYGQHSIQRCVEGDVVVFYMYQVGLSTSSDVEVYVTRISDKDGSKKWTTKLTTMPEFKAGLSSLPLCNDAYYVTKRMSGLDSPESPVKYYMQPVNVNGALSTDPTEIPTREDTERSERRLVCCHSRRPHRDVRHRKR